MVFQKFAFLKSLHTCMHSKVSFETSDFGTTCRFKKAGPKAFQMRASPSTLFAYLRRSSLEAKKAYKSSEFSTCTKMEFARRSFFFVSMVRASHGLKPPQTTPKPSKEKNFRVRYFAHVYAF